MRRLSCAGLDALGHRLHVERAGHRDDRRDEALLGVVEVERLDERPVDLHALGREPLRYASDE